MRSQSAEAFVVVDMQVDFVAAGAPAAVTGAPAIVAHIDHEAQRVRSSGGIVVWVTRSYTQDGSNVEPARRAAWSRNPFVVSGTPGADLAPGLEALDGDLRLCKPRWSAFFATTLDAELRTRGVSRILVAGVDLSRCVRATVMDALSLDYDVRVLRDGVATRSTEALSANLEDLRDLGVEVVEAA